MTRAALAGVAGLAVAFALTVSPPGLADEPIRPGDAATVYVTVTTTVPARYHGGTARMWAREARQRHLDADARGRTVTRLRRAARARWAPSLTLGINLARAVYGVDLTRRTFCESRNDVWARNPSGASGPLQFLPSTWASTPFRGFSVFDPVAAELAGGWMVAVAHRSGEWTCRL